MPRPYTWLNHPEVSRLLPRPTPSLALFTDLYELTMAQAYWQSGRTAEATFSLFIRSFPHDRAYWVCAGLQDALNDIEGLRFTEDDIAALRDLDRFDPGFLDYLRRLEFAGSARAMPEGSVFFDGEPVLEVTAPIIQAQLLETILINRINLQTILATKASRVVQAANGRTVVDFAARRAQGIEAADRLARASYIAGYAGTSNVAAGIRYGIPTVGTMAHSFIMCFDSEYEAFRAYAASFPGSSTFLVDTYDTTEGVRAAIAVAGEMREAGQALRAIRIDSGDFAALAAQARTMLDGAGLREVEIFVSGGLDEFEVDSLVRAQAPIDGFGVGTKAGVSADAPWTDCAYKLVEYDGAPLLKLSTGKTSLPGGKQVYRSRDDEGRFLRDTIALDDEPPPDGAAPLLEEVVCGGRIVSPSPPLPDIRARLARELASLPAPHKALKSPARYEVRVSDRLDALRARLVRSARQAVATPPQNLPERT